MTELWEKSMVYSWRDVVSEANTTNLLCQVDVSINLGGTVTSKLAKLGVPAEEKKMQFKMGCKKCWES